jgi:molybdopterin-guanine dinucleotide biosynthesis protein A
MMTGFLEDVNVRFVDASEWERLDPQGVSFLNVNTEDDLRRAEQMLASGT